MEIESRMVGRGKATDAWNHGPECENIDVPAQSVETSCCPQEAGSFYSVSGGFYLANMKH